MSVQRILGVIAFLVFTLPCSLSYAEREEVPLPTLVGRSPLIVIGTLDNVKEFSKKGVDYGEGEISINEVLFGTVGQQKKLILKWSNPSGIACPRDEHGGAKKQKLIWVFDSIEKQSVFALPEGRVLLDRKAHVLDLIKTKKKP